MPARPEPHTCAPPHRKTGKGRVSATCYLREKEAPRWDRRGSQSVWQAGKCAHDPNPQPEHAGPPPARSLQLDLSSLVGKWGHCRSNQLQTLRQVMLVSGWTEREKPQRRRSHEGGGRGWHGALPGQGQGPLSWKRWGAFPPGPPCPQPTSDSSPELGGRLLWFSARTSAMLCYGKLVLQGTEFPFRG